MMEEKKMHFDARAKVLKALAHPTRLFIIEEIEKGENNVNALTAMIGADVSTVSKHLAVLKHAGIVIDEKRGNQVFYRLTVPCITNFFGCIETVLARQHAQQAMAIGAPNSIG
jgi:ArsR family transcriptional regulator